MREKALIPAPVPASDSDVFLKQDCGQPFAL